MSNPVSLIRNVDLTLLGVIFECDCPFSVKVGVCISICNTNLSHACNRWVDHVGLHSAARRTSRVNPALGLASLTSHCMQIIFWSQVRHLRHILHLLSIFCYGHVVSTLNLLDIDSKIILREKGRSSGIKLFLEKYAQKIIKIRPLSYWLLTLKKKGRKFLWLWQMCANILRVVFLCLKIFSTNLNNYFFYGKHIYLHIRDVKWHIFFSVEKITLLAIWLSFSQSYGPLAH